MSEFPRGWFVVGFREELEPEQVRPARYFDGIDYDTKTGRLLGEMWIDALNTDSQ